MSAYCNHHSVSIIHNNKSVREYGEDGLRVVRLPFDSEYKLRLKNKNYWPCKVSVEIDGMDALGGGKLIIKGGETLDLERFVTSLKEGKKFKFTSLEKGTKDGSIQDPDSPDNGKIVVKFWQQKPVNITSTLYTYTYPNTYWDSGTGSISSNGINYWQSASHGALTTPVRGTCTVQNLSREAYSSGQCDVTNASSGCVTNTCGVSVDTLDCASGATVEGGNSYQSFEKTEDFPTASWPETTIEIWLKGTEKPTSHFTDAELIKRFYIAKVRKDHGDMAVLLGELTNRDWLIPMMQEVLHMAD